MELLIRIMLDLVCVIFATVLIIIVIAANKENKKLEKRIKQHQLQVRGRRR